MLRTRTRWALVVGFVVLAGCRHKIPAPYARGQGPVASDLLARTGAQLPALQVSDATVVANRVARGNLAFIAEAPGRFRGTVGLAGNELVTLAFHEQGYALRYKMDAFPPGYYAGPPSDCAVQALLGVSFATEGLVDLVLGGAPVIEAPFEVRDQKWSSKGGYESLTIANDRLVQELRFGWVGNEWRVVGGQLWARNGDGVGERYWTVEHVDLQAEGEVYLPKKTKVMTPGKRRDVTVVINYKKRDLDPAFAKNRKQAGGKGGDSDPFEEDGDPWEDEGDPWEDEGAEWEDGAEAAGSAEAPAEGGPASTEATGDQPAEPGSEASAAEQAPPPAEQAPPPAEQAPPPAAKEPEPSGPPPIPPEFSLEPTGLTVRGDLCR
ncbi:MAG: hypothetical protein AAF799_23490 [Myxococcota bacterium]